MRGGVGLPLWPTERDKQKGFVLGQDKAVKEMRLSSKQGGVKRRSESHRRGVGSEEPRRFFFWK